MKTSVLRFLPKSNQKQWPQGEAPFFLRLKTFLLRDVLPSLVMVIIVAILASLVGEKIDQAKDSRFEPASEISSPR